MRWEELFDDLSGQAAAAEGDERQGEIVDRGRYETGRVSLAERLRSVPLHRRLLIVLPGGDPLTGSVLAVGLDWVAVRAGAQEWLLPLAAVRRVQVLPGPEAGDPPLRGAGLASPADPVRATLGLSYAVRYLVRDRTVLALRLVDGDVLTGTADRAGLDHLELAEHPADLPRRARSVRATWIVPYAGIAAICGGQVWSES
jgi:hypothetical protein